MVCGKHECVQYIFFVLSLLLLYCFIPDAAIYGLMLLRSKCVPSCS